jgi:hypothetical protein
MIPGPSAKRKVLPGKLQALLWFFIAGFVWTTPLNVAAQSGLGLIIQSNWFGDPYLVTNSPDSALSPYRVCLVMNPALVTNQDYQEKVSALVIKVSDQQNRLAAQIFQALSAVSFQPKSREALTRVASAPTQGQQPGDKDDGEGKVLWWSLFQRWILFCLVALLLVRRVWRYFHEVEDDDDFADHLATLAVAYRWVFPVYLALLILVAVAEFFQIGNFFFSLSVLALAFSIRRYYCEADFANYPRAQLIHLAMSLLLIWLGWIQGQDHNFSNLSTWCHWPVFAWVMLALATLVFSQFYNYPDLAEHRQVLFFFMAGFLVCGILGGTAGYCYWIQYVRDGSPWTCLLAGGIVACLPLGFYFYRWNVRVSEQLVGRTIFDMIFSYGGFSEKILKKRRLPEILLLRHWRDHGDVEKAWQTAKGKLFKEARALPVWLFALETAVLYRRKPDDALEILKQLCVTDEFHYDHRVVAVGMMQGWMAAAGFSFDPARFKIERPPLAPSELTDKVKEKCRAGRFADAEILLQEALGRDSLNEQAFIQLVRLYCQDMKNRPAAEKLIAGAGNTFSPKLLDYMSGLLDEWMQLPVRSVVKRRTFLDWFRQQDRVEPVSKGISTIPPPVTSKPAPPEAADPLEAHLERLKQTRETMPAHTGGHDPIDQLLAEQRLGTAVELLKQQAESSPKDFNLWLRYAEAHGLHCGNLTTATKIVRQMERSGNFKKAQIKKAYTRLKKWHEKHPLRHTGW